MVTVIHSQRRASVLSPSSLACLSHIPTVNLTAGCAVGCIYCYTLGYSSHPGDDKIVLYENILEKLTVELSRKQTKPRAVFFSPSSDLFQPVPEVLELGHQILEFLFSKGIGVVFLTKGEIPQKTMELLFTHVEMVKAEMGIITLDENVARMFEPNAAPPAVRVEQAARLIRGGIPTEVRVDPILPGITNDPDALDQLFSSLARAGVKRVAAGTLFLRPAILGSLKRSVSNERTLKLLLSAYGDAQRIEIRAEHSSVVSLGSEKRQEIFERVQYTAKKHGVEVSVCACKNPDLARGTCGISGSWPKQSRPAIQKRLVL